MAGNVLRNLRIFPITIHFHTNKNHRSIIKTRYVEQKTNHMFIRIDTDNKPNSFFTNIRNSINYDDYSAVVISDYDKGYINYDLFDILAPKNPNIKIFVDTKKTKLPVHYNNIVYKINKKEFELLDPNHIPRGENMIVTHGANGALWNKKQIPVPITRVFDVTGAGDTFLAALVWYYIQLPSMEEAIAFANRCAAIAVQNPGTYTLKMDDVDGILGK